MKSKLKSGPEVGLPLFRSKDRACERGFLWLMKELHPGFRGSPVPFPVVTVEAGGHDVFPGLSPTTGFRKNVVHRQLVSIELVAAVLTSLTISFEEAFPCETGAPSEILDATNQSNDGWYQVSLGSTIDLPWVRYNCLGFLKPHQQECTPPANNHEWFVTLI